MFVIFSAGEGSLQDKRDVTQILISQVGCTSICRMQRHVISVFIVRQIDDGIGFSFVAPGRDPKIVSGDNSDVMFDRESI